MCLSLKSLSPSQRQLVQLMQKLNYGRIEQLHVRDGQPLLEPAPRLIREHRFGLLCNPRRQLTSADFVLKAAVRDLLAQLHALQNGTIERVQVRDGLPYTMAVEASL